MPTRSRSSSPDGFWASTYRVLAHSGLPGKGGDGKLTAGRTLQIPGHRGVCTMLQVD